MPFLMGLCWNIKKFLMISYAECKHRFLKETQQKNEEIIFELNYCQQLPSNIS